MGGTRRGAARSATAKSKYVFSASLLSGSVLLLFYLLWKRLATSEAGRSASPHIASENGHLSDDGKATNKAKGKSKAKRTGAETCSLLMLVS